MAGRCTPPLSLALFLRVSCSARRFRKSSRQRDGATCSTRTWMRFLMMRPLTCMAAPFSAAATSQALQALRQWSKRRVRRRFCCPEHRPQLPASRDAGRCGCQNSPNGADKRRFAQSVINSANMRCPCSIVTSRTSGPGLAVPTFGPGAQTLLPVQSQRPPVEMLHMPQNARIWSANACMLWHMRQLTALGVGEYMRRCRSRPAPSLVGASASATRVQV